MSGAIAGIFIFLLLLVLAGWLLARRTAVPVAERLLYPEVRSPATTPADYGMENAEQVTISSGDLQLAAWFIPPPQPEGALVIYLHGFSGTRAALLEPAAALYAAGHGALLLDLRGHGGSDPAPVTWGYSEVDDVIAAYRYAAARPEVNPERIGLMGKSMGGAAVSGAAAQLPELAFVVLESSYSGLEHNFPAIVTLIGGGPAYLSGMTLRVMSRQTGLPLADVRPEADLAAVPAPVLIIHGDRDQIVSPDQGEALFAAAGEPKQLYLVPGAGHLDTFTVDPDRYSAALTAFVTMALSEGDQ